MDVVGGIRILSHGELKPEAVEVETWIPPLVPQDRADLERLMGQLRVWADGLKRPSQHQASSELDSESEQPYLFPTPLLAHPLTKSFSSAPPQPGAPPRSRSRYTVHLRRPALFLLKCCTSFPRFLPPGPW